MKITRLHTDADGHSRFEDLTLQLEDAGELGWLSEIQEATGTIFRRNDRDYELDWHPAPQRQYIVMLDGEIEIETSLGEKRRFRGGEVLLVEDTWGRGHRTRSVDGQERRSIFITLPPATDEKAADDQTISTPDLCDAHPEARVLDSVFHHFGAVEAFGGEVVTVRCFEDNSKVKELAATEGGGRVLVVDGGGSLRRALLGDQIAARAAENGWAGFVIHGAVRDVEVLRTLPIGIAALGAAPRKTEKRGLGDVGVALRFGGVDIADGEHIYCDRSGVIVASEDLLA